MTGNDTTGSEPAADNGRPVDGATGVPQFLVLTAPDLAFGLPGWVDYWREQGGFTDADDRLWRSRLAASAGNGFVFAVTYHVTSAVKP